MLQPGLYLGSVSAASKECRAGNLATMRGSVIWFALAVAWGLDSALALFHHNRVQGGLTGFFACCFFAVGLPSASGSGESCVRRGPQRRVGRVAANRSAETQVERTPEYTAIPATASTPIASRASISACSRMPPATISCRLRLLPQALRHLDRKALHGPLPVDMRIEKAAAIRLQLGKGFVRGKLHLVLPALHRDSPLFRIHAEDQLLHPHRRRQLAANPVFTRSAPPKSAEPTITRRAPADSTAAAFSTVPIPPPTWQGNRAWRSWRSVRYCLPAAWRRRGRSTAPADTC